MLACIIPAYKPSREGLVGFTNRILSECEDLLPVVVNDGSGAEFDEVFASLDPRVKVLTHTVNRGKGRALKTAIEYVKDNMPNVSGAVTADADGQHRLEDVQSAARELMEHPNALILGGRRFDGNVPLRSRFGNSLTRNVFAIASGTKVYDTQTGLRAFSRNRFERMLEIRGERYEYEMNMLLYLAREGTPIREITIETVYIDDNSASHFNPIKDSLKIYFCIFKFVMSSFAAFVIDYIAFLLLLPAMQSLLSNSNHEMSKTALAALSLALATVIARVISATVNFAINKWVVFKSREKTGRALLKFFALAAVIVVLDYGLVYFMTNICGVHQAIAKIVSGIILFFVNMVVQGRLVFRKKPVDS